MSLTAVRTLLALSVVPGAFAASSAFASVGRSPSSRSAIVVAQSAGLRVVGSETRVPPRHVRPGCGPYCRNLGGGGGTAPGPPPSHQVQLLSHTVRVHGRIAPIDVRCVARHRCDGAILLASETSSGSRLGAGVDLVIPARTELVIEVTLPVAYARAVRAAGRLAAQVDVTYKCCGGDDRFKITLVS